MTKALLPKRKLLLLGHLEQWEEEGARSAELIGIEKAKNWLARYEPPPIDPGLDQALLDYVKRRESELSERVE